MLYKRFCKGPHDGLEEFEYLHSGSWVLGRKVLLLKYYWPTLLQDSQFLVRNCPSCQFYAPKHHQLTHQMVLISSPWPFEQWGTDIIGPFPLMSRGFQFVIVVVDYFVKWVEAEPLTKITGKVVQLFFWKNVIRRFGLPQVIISDNG